MTACASRAARSDVRPMTWCAQGVQCGSVPIGGRVVEHTNDLPRGADCVDGSHQPGDLTTETTDSQDDEPLHAPLPAGRAHELRHGGGAIGGDAPARQDRPDGARRGCAGRGRGCGCRRTPRRERAGAPRSSRCGPPPGRGRSARDARRGAGPARVSSGPGTARAAGEARPTTSRRAPRGPGPGARRGSSTSGRRPRRVIRSSSLTSPRAGSGSTIVRNLTISNGIAVQPGALLPKQHRRAQPSPHRQGDDCLDRQAEHQGRHADDQVHDSLCVRHGKPPHRVSRAATRAGHR